MGLGGLINAGIQYAYDSNNPYLSSPQKFQRAGISGGFGLASGTFGLIAASAFGGPVGIGVGFTLGIIFELQAAPWVFEKIGAIPTRELERFQVP